MSDAIHLTSLTSPTDLTVLTSCSRVSQNPRNSQSHEIFQFTFFLPKGCVRCVCHPPYPGSHVEHPKHATWVCFGCSMAPLPFASTPTPETQLCLHFGRWLAPRRLPLSFPPIMENVTLCRIFHASWFTSPAGHEKHAHALEGRVFRI